MNSIDQYQFDEIQRPFYDWERQLINLRCKVSDIDIANSRNSMSEDGKKQISILIHEYIHFLQNFSTSWGACVFTDFSLALMKIGVSSALSKEVLESPLSMPNLKNSMLIDGLNLRKAVVDRINKCNNSQEHENGILVKLSIINSNEKCKIITNGKITVELGGKVIREHMAYLGTQLFLKKTDEEIHDYNEKNDSFTSNGIGFSKQPEYWVLYEYLYHLNLFSSLAKGVFYLTQQCLITLNPELALLRFMNWLQKNKAKFRGKPDFVNVIEDWLKTGKEALSFKGDFTKSVMHCESVLKLTMKYINENHIYLFTHNIIEYSLKNIQNTHGGKFLFMPSDDFTNVNYWKNKISHFGTGIVRYLDNTLIHGTAEHCTKMHDSFNFLVSCSLVLEKILNNKQAICPFLEDLPICRASFKEHENCYMNPFSMIQHDSSGQECLFVNGIILLGMVGRVKFGIK